MDVSFCVSALEEALARFGTPKIFNTDQASQFISAAVTGTLAAAGGGEVKETQRYGSASFLERGPATCF